MSFDPENPIGSVFADIVGKRAWHVRKGYSSFVTMEFGEPQLRVREPMPNATSPALHRPRVSVRGDWHFWVHSCEWRISENGVELAHSESKDDEIDKAASAIDGQILTAVEVDPATGVTRLSFELGTIFEMVPYDAKSDSWLLSVPGGWWLCVRGGGCYRGGQGSQKPDEHVWLPIWSSPQ